MPPGCPQGSPGFSPGLAAQKNDPVRREAVHRIWLMNPSPRHVSFLLAAVLAVTAVCLAALLRASRGRPAPPPPPPPVRSAPVTPETASKRLPPDALSALAPASPAETIRSRYLLAGTLLTYGMDIGSIAVLVDRVSARSHKLQKGESVPGTDIVVEEILEDAAILRTPRTRETLPVELPLQMGGDGTERVVSNITTNSFGTCYADSRLWDLSRKKMEARYAELLADPERLVYIFDTMEPVYPDGDTSKEIEGYVVNIQGEEQFFTELGLGQGDIVRSVNGVRMANRRLAEMFIEAFVNGEEDKFVLAVDRDGVREEQTYLIH